MKLSRKKTVFWIAIQEALISLAPYIFIRSVIVLLSQFSAYFHLKFASAAHLSLLSETLVQFTSIGMVVSVAYVFSVRYNTEHISTILLSLAVFGSITALSSTPRHHLVLPYEIDGYQIFSPIVTTLIFAKLSKKFDIALPTQRGRLFVARIFEHIYSFVLTYAVMIALFFSLYHLFSEFVESLSALYLTRGVNTQFVIRTVLVQLFWYIGIHGSRMTKALFDTSFLEKAFIFPHLRYQDFFTLFAAAGGSGMGIALLIALLIRLKDEINAKLVKLSVPFVIFNINTLIIYGLPVVLNRYLLLPFLLIPLINSGIAYIALLLHPVHFTNAHVNWITPVFLNAYIVTNGNSFVILLQLFLIILDVLIYLPFLKKYNAAYSIDAHRRALSQNLGIIPALKSKEGVMPHQKQQAIMTSNYRLGKTIKMLRNNSLELYYQPKVDIINNKCDSYEALLRIHTADNQIQGPFFLQELENAGLSPVIDLWVCKKVREDIEYWASSDFFPSISINLHPDTLQDDDTIKQITKILDGQNIEFEILERALLGGENMQRNLTYLKDKGFHLAIDDYGEGYTSHQLFNTGAIDTLKIDKSMVDMITENSGLIICQSIISLCELLNFKCVVEGVETPEQLMLLKRVGARFIQGYVFSEALPPRKIQTYTPKSFFESRD